MIISEHVGSEIGLLPLAGHGGERIYLNKGDQIYLNNWNQIYLNNWNQIYLNNWIKYS